MRAAAELLEHVSCIFNGTGLAENFVVEDDDRVGCERDRRSDGPSGDEIRLGIGQTLDERRRRFTRIGRLIHSGRKNGKRQARIGENFGAARGRGGENELHDGLGERILHGML